MSPLKTLKAKANYAPGSFFFFVPPAALLSTRRGTVRSLSMEHLMPALAAPSETRRNDYVHDHRPKHQHLARRSPSPNICASSRYNAISNEYPNRSTSSCDIHPCSNMSPSWLCCLDERLRRRNRKKTKDLDGRFGDMSISGPIMGGWNQASVSSQHSSPHPASTTNESCRPEKPRSRPPTRNNSGSSGRRSTSRGDSSSAEKNSHESLSIHRDKPGFVYKPASEGFFKTIGDIRRPTEAPQQKIPARHQRHPSVRSESPMEPSSPAIIPCHPWYHPEPLQHSPAVTPASTHIPERTSAYPPNQFIDRRRYYASSDHSEPDSAEEGVNYFTQKNTPRFNFTTPSVLKRNKSKQTARRSVTEEMVPESNELFG